MRYAERFLDWLEESGQGWTFDENSRRQFIMSVWLHDIGKLVIPLEVMDKASRLGARLPAVLHRIQVAALQARISLLEGRVDQAACNAQLAALNDARTLVEESNIAGFLPDETLDAIRAAGALQVPGADGAPQPLLTEDELECLLVQRGTLTAGERRVMESHAAMTARLLGEMAFSRNYRNVPRWAAAHHEAPNGRGYPLGLAGDEIIREVRLLSVLDVYDALTARDRPYKPPLPPEKAFSVLESMAVEGQLDPKMVALFRQSGAWEERD